ncbi:DUF6194 family protein [Chitinophaga caseinilytica]|uniref:DUF6194 family protein n=1 Tax=Chitinophaga caseinilytica TaxID=2267521 RepID=UPI003C2D4759
MTVDLIEQFIIQNLPDTTRLEHGGYIFYFYSTDQMLPFVSIAIADNEYDHVSELSREGVFRVNIGVLKETFAGMFPEPSAEWDYAVLDRFLPHPHYAAQHYICILNPEGANAETTCRLMEEAWGIAKRRFEKKHPQG